jgi:hypothetical protein
VKVPGTDEWYIAYHRRPLDDTNGYHRELAIDRLYFNDDGTIRPVSMSNEGVAPRPIGPAARGSRFPGTNCLGSSCNSLPISESILFTSFQCARIWLIIC